MAPYVVFCCCSCLLHGSMRGAFRDDLLHISVVTSGYLRELCYSGPLSPTSQTIAVWTEYTWTTVPVHCLQNTSLLTPLLPPDFGGPECTNNNTKELAYKQIGQLKRWWSWVRIVARFPYSYLKQLGTDFELVCSQAILTTWSAAIICNAVLICTCLSNIT